MRPGAHRATPGSQEYEGAPPELQRTWRPQRNDARNWNAKSGPAPIMSSGRNCPEQRRYALDRGMRGQALVGSPRSPRQASQVQERPAKSDHQRNYQRRLEPHPFSTAATEKGLRSVRMMRAEAPDRVCRPTIPGSCRVHLSWTRFCRDVELLYVKSSHFLRSCLRLEAIAGVGTAQSWAHSPRLCLPIRSIRRFA